jgi:hypothetical protein
LKRALLSGEMKQVNETDGGNATRDKLLVMTDPDGFKRLEAATRKLSLPRDESGLHRPPQL